MKLPAGHQYSYTSRNQLIEVKIFAPSSDILETNVIKVVKYQYDALGRRIKKSVWDKENETDIKKTFARKYVYDGDNIFLELDNNNELLAKYTFNPAQHDNVLGVQISDNGVLAGLSQNSGKYYYLKDSLGSVSDVTNGEGTVVQSYDYSAFGKILKIRDTEQNDISLNPYIRTSYTFTGREWDEDSNLYYYRARYYDPSIGRFLQTDASPGRGDLPITIINKYCYAANSPTVYKDSSGKIFGIDDLIVIAITVGVAVAASNVAAAMNAGVWDISKILGTALNGFAYGFGSTFLTAGTGIMAGIAITAGLAMAHNGFNQTIFSGRIKDWDSLVASGVAGGLGALAGAGASKLSDTLFGSTSKVLGFPVGKAAQEYNGVSGAMGALFGTIYGATVTSSMDNNGIPNCMDAVNCLATDGK